MTDQFTAAAAAHDAHALAAQHPGQVTVHSTLESFTAAIRQAEEREKVRDEDSRTVEQLRGEYGELHQRQLDAWWYGTTDQTIAAQNAFVRAAEHPSYGRLFVTAAVVEVGDYVHVRGYGWDEERSAATGVVEAVEYTEREIDPYRCGEIAMHYGHTFTLRTVVPEWLGGAADPVEIWVRETCDRHVLRLPAPVDRGRPAWLDAP